MPGAGERLEEPVVPEVLKNYIDGKWVESRAGGRVPVYNPAEGTVIAETPLSGSDQVEAAVAAAKEAFPAWRATPPVERARVLFAWKNILEENFEHIARTLTEENGKMLREARGEVRRGIEVVEFGCGMPTLLMGESLKDVARGIDTVTLREPLGVCAGITPFNFPAMIPLWMMPLAVGCGNTFVLKPSEQTARTPTLLFELLAEVTPRGVINLVHGAKDAVDALLTHPDVKAVSFVGSSRVAEYIYRTAAAEGKRVQASGGAKNFLIVMPDADLDKAVDGFIGSCFGCAGERCLAGSVGVPVGEVAEPFLEKLVATAGALKMGPGLDESTQMPPVISREHMERVLACIEKGIEEGARLILDGRNRIVEGHEGGFYIGPTIFDHVRPEMTIAREEIFGPVLSIIRAGDLDEALELANRSEYGNAASIFTGSGRAARDFYDRIQAGMVGVNVGVAAPMTFFPFAGWKRSFFGDLHSHGKDGIRFYTETRVVISRWF